MRRSTGALLLIALVATACGSSTGPSRHSLIGRWRSEAVVGVTIEMVVSESARSVHGAGRWITADSTVAFGISGASTGTSASLLFSTSPEVNFLGDFVDDDTMEGTMVGANFASRAVRFVRVEDDD
jgi:hypothetical protein